MPKKAPTKKPKKAAKPSARPVTAVDAARRVAADLLQISHALDISADDARNAETERVFLAIGAAATRNTAASWEAFARYLEGGE